MAAGPKPKNRERGHVDELPSGALRVRVYAGIDPVTKRRHYLTEIVPAGPQSAKLAEKTRTKLLSQVDERRNPRTSATVNQLLTRYLDQFTGDRSTLATYRRYVRLHVQPLLGTQKVGRIDADTLDSFYAELRRCRNHCSGRQPTTDHRTPRDHACDHRCRPHECKPLGPSAVRQIHFILSGAFKRAVRWHWVSVNPVTDAEPPAAPKPKPKPPSADEAARILNASWRNPDWATLVWLTMTTGARRGEQCGLRWKHIDLERGVLTYERSIGHDDAGTWEKDTKDHQQRRVALDSETVAVLTEHRQRCQARAETVGVKLSGETFVFSPAADGSDHLKPATLTQRYGRLVARLGIHTSLHKLRHYSATELIKAGVDISTVAGRLGHGGGGATTLRVYTAWTSEADQRASISMQSRMPPRPSASIPFAHIIANPENPYERIAAILFSRVAAGQLEVGDHLPSVKDIAAEGNVSQGTAHRALTLLKEWGVIDASRGRRATIIASLSVSAVRAHTEEKSRVQQSPAAEVALLDFQLRKNGEVVSAFSSNANPSDAKKLEQLLVGAVRRQGADRSEIDLYELEVRPHGVDTLLTTFVSTS